MGRSIFNALTAGLLAAALTLAPGTAVAGNGVKEGIHVKGEWVIDVLEADGTLVSHHEFHNDLQATGGELLAQLLSRQAMGRWTVELLTGAGATAPCVDARTGIDVCGINEPNPLHLPGDNESMNLALSRSGGTLTLSGSITANRAGSVSGVRTRFGTCAGTTTPAACRPLGGNIFTATNLTAQNVADGQIIQVTVNISFQ